MKGSHSVEARGTKEKLWLEVRSSQRTQRTAQVHWSLRDSLKQSVRMETPLIRYQPGSLLPSTSIVSPVRYRDY